MRRSIWALVALFLLGTNAVVRAAETMRAASGGFTTAIHAVLWAAYEEKLFKKYGLDVEYLALNSGRLGMQMLLSDDVQMLFSTGVTVVTTNLQKADLAIIAGGLNFFPTKLIVRPEVKRAADLKGKKNCCPSLSGFTWKSSASIRRMSLSSKWAAQRHN